MTIHYCVMQISDRCQENVDNTKRVLDDSGAQFVEHRYFSYHTEDPYKFLSQRGIGLSRWKDFSHRSLPPMIGELGYLCSLIGLFESLLRKGVEEALVFDDDAVVDRAFVEIVNKARTYDYDVFNFSYPGLLQWEEHGSKEMEIDDFAVVADFKRGFSQASLYTKQGMQKFLKALRRYGPVGATDLTIDQFGRERLLRCLCVHPESFHSVRLKEAGSEIDPLNLRHIDPSIDPSEEAYTILTMSRGDEERLEEWVRYHSQIGFDEFIILLDDPIDDSESVLKRLSQEFRIVYQVKEPYGAYFDRYGDSYYDDMQRWREENKELIQFVNPNTFSPISLRQYTYFPSLLHELSNRSKGWICLIDLDEFIVLEKYGSVKELTKQVSFDRIGFLNFDFDTSDHKKGESFTRSHTKRWDRKDIVEYGEGWDSRIKSIVKCNKCLPFDNLHAISLGERVYLDPSEARLHHYKIPLAPIGLPYSVEDVTLKEFWKGVD